MRSRNMFSLDEICLRCSLFFVLCTTTLAAPGGLGSFAQSGAVAFSSASSNAQAGSLANAASSAHAVSSANAFASGFPHGGGIPSNNKDVNHESFEHPGVFAGTGSYVGYGSNKPGSNNFSVTHHQVSGNTGNSHDNKSPVSCAPCQNKENQWEREDLDYDEQNKEKESEQEKESDDSYDDGQYRPEHHYYGDANKKEKEQTASGIHKIEDNDSYDYNHQGVKGGHFDYDTDEQENADYESYYKDVENADGYGSKINNNAGSTHPQTQHSSHFNDVNKQKENGHVNAGTSGSVVAPDLNSYNKDKSTNAGTFGVATGGKTNLDSISGINAGCSDTRPGSNCGESSTGLSQGPIKLDQSDIVQTPSVPAVGTEQNKGPAGCGNNFYGNCGNVKPDGHYPSVSDNKHNLPNIGNIGTQNKLQLPDKPSTGQWPGTGKKPSFDQQSTGQWPGAGNKPSLNQPSTGQWPGAGNKPSLSQPSTGQWPGAGNKPSLDQQSTGQWSGAGNKPSFDQQNTGQWSGAGNKHSFDQQSTGQWSGAGNKPSFDQQSTGQWPGAGDKSSVNQQGTGDFGHHGSTHGSGNTHGQSSVSYPGEASTLQKNIPIPTETYSTVGGGTPYSGNKNTATKEIIYGGAPGHGGTYYPESSKGSHGPIGVSTPSTGQPANIGSSFPHGLGTTGFPQNGLGIKQPTGSGNCGTFGGSPCTSGTGYPGSTGITGVQTGQNVQGQTYTGNAGDGHADKNIYQVNKANPFLYDVQGNFHTTSSPVQVPSNIGVVETTDKPIGLGNPFLDGSLQISNTHGTHNIHTDQSDHNKVVTTTETSNKPIGVGNPFLTHGHGNGHGTEHGIGHGSGQGDGHGNGHGIGHGHGYGHGHKGDSPIYNIGITIGGTPPTSALPSVTTTVKPIGKDNPFFQPSGGDGTNKHHTGCSDAKPGSNCGASGTDLSQGPVKLDQSDIVQTPNVPALETESNKGPVGCGGNLHGNCGSTKPDGIGQYPSTSGNKENLPNVGNTDTQNKLQFPDKQSTGQWPGAGNKPSFDQQATGQWPGAGNKPSFDQQSTGQLPGVGNKPSLNQPSTGQWPGAGNKPSLNQPSTGQWPGAGNKPSLDQQSTGQWPGAGNKPSLDQQSTGQLTGNKEHSGGNQGHKNTVIGSGTTYPANPIQSNPTDNDAIHFPKVGYAGIGIPSSEINRNINQGVKGDSHHNKEFGGIANINAGVSATGNVNTPNIPGAPNSYNNVGHHGGSNVPGSSGYTVTPQTSGTGVSTNNKETSDSNALINENNANNQHIPQVVNGAALSLATANAGSNAGGHAGAHAGSYSSSFSSSQASSSSFAASQSASYAASGDLSDIAQQMKGPWPFDNAKNINLNSSWANATSQASSFAANNSGRWSGLHPVGVKSR